MATTMMAIRTPEDSLNPLSSPDAPAASLTWDAGAGEEYGLGGACARIQSGAKNNSERLWANMTQEMPRSDCKSGCSVVYM